MLAMAISYNVTQALEVSLNSGADVPVAVGDILPYPGEEVVFVHSKALTIYKISEVGANYFLDYFGVVPTFIGANDVSRSVVISDVDEDGLPGLVVSAHDSTANNANLYVVWGKNIRSALLSPTTYTVASSDASLGSFGASMVASGSRIVVGDPTYAGGGTSRGQIWVVDYDGTSFSTAATVTGANDNEKLSSGLALGNFYGNSTKVLAVGVPGAKKVVLYDFEGDFSSTLGEIADTSKTDFGTHVAFWDGDNDGKGELVIGDGSNCYVYEYRAAGPALVATVSGALEPLSVADFNGDGYEDLLVKTSGGAAVIKGGSYSATVDAASSDYSFVLSKFYQVLLSDLNADGYADVVVSPDSTSGSGYVFFSPLPGFYAELPLSSDFELPFSENAYVVKGYGPSGVQVRIFPYNYSAGGDISFRLRFVEGSDYVEKLTSSIRIAFPVPSYDNFALYFYNETTGQWEPQRRTFSINSTHVVYSFGTGGVYALKELDEFADSLAQAYVFPNPADYGEKIFFGGITGNVTAKIYTPAGRLIRVVTMENGSLYWDGKDQAGSLADRGVYIVILEDASARTKKILKVFLK